MNNSISLQEMITRGRFIFHNAPSRLETFNLVNGKLNTKEIAIKSGRHPNSIRRDLNDIANAGLIQPVVDNGGEKIKDGFPVYEKVPLAKIISPQYFTQPKYVPKMRDTVIKSTGNVQNKNVPSITKLNVPTEAEVLDIANRGESQLFEFKAQGTDPNKISREICAMLNTKTGGIIFYGIDDDGTIEGSDKGFQEFDQPLQNSIRNIIAPAATVDVHSIDVMGSQVLAIIVPPWNKKDVYQYSGKILIRRGTNVFSAKPEEIRMLHDGKFVI